MKDLYVLTADADALAFMNSILQRPKALGIRPLNFDLDRHPLRDAGMVQSGAELARMKKGHYHKVLLMLDHHGSGRDKRQSSDETAAEIQAKLDSFTWMENSIVAVLQPELEKWLWHTEATLASYYHVKESQLCEWITRHAGKVGVSEEILKREQPKELFEYVLRDCLLTTISPKDFEELGKKASIKKLLGCDSFRVMVEALRIWFPQ